MSKKNDRLYAVANSNLILDNVVRARNEFHALEEAYRDIMNAEEFAEIEDDGWASRSIDPQGTEGGYHVLLIGREREGEAQELVAEDFVRAQEMAEESWFISRDY